MATSLSGQALSVYKAPEFQWFFGVVFNNCVTSISCMSVNGAYRALVKTTSNGAFCRELFWPKCEQSERLGLSRTPPGEALGRLSAEGLTQTARGRRVVVTDIRWMMSMSSSSCKKSWLRSGKSGVFAALHAELRDAPLLLSAADPGPPRLNATVGRLNEAISAGDSGGWQP